MVSPVNPFTFSGIRGFPGATGGSPYGTGAPAQTPSMAAAHSSRGSFFGAKYCGAQHYMQCHIIRRCYYVPNYCHCGPFFPSPKPICPVPFWPPNMPYFGRG